MSRLRDFVAHRLIGTPLEPPLRWLRSTKDVVARRRHPEWNPVRDEGRYIEELLREVIEPTSNCIDVGCHLGSVLDRMRRYAPHGRHMAFEPTPHKCEWLKRKYPDVEVRQEALSDQPGEVEFFHQVDHSGFSGLRSHAAPAWRTESYRVQCHRLDDVVAPDRRVDFIKIDVEGAEPLVLRGAREVLRRSGPALLFECTLSGLALYAVSPDTVYDQLCRDLGYRIYLIKDWLEARPPLDPRRFAEAMEYPAQAFNFFATKGERRP